MLPCALGCSGKHASRVVACPSSVGELAMSSPLNSSSTWPVWVTSNFILSISSSILALLFRSLAPVSCNSQSFIFSCRTTSHNYWIPSCKSSCLGRTVWVMACPTMDRVPLAYPTLCTVLLAQRTLITCRFSWVGVCATYNHTLHYRWMTSLLQRGCHVHPSICTRNHLLPLSFLYAHHLGVRNTSSNAPSCFWATIEVSGLTSCPSFVAPLSFDHCLTSVVTHHND